MSVTHCKRTSPSRNTSVPLSTTTTISKPASPTDTSPSPPNSTITQRIPTATLPNIPSVVQHTQAGMRRRQSTGKGFDGAAGSGNGGQGIRDEVPSSQSVPTDTANVARKPESAGGLDEGKDATIAPSRQSTRRADVATSDKGSQRSLKHSHTEVDVDGTSTIRRNSMESQSSSVANKSSEERVSHRVPDRRQSQESDEGTTNASHRDDGKNPDRINVPTLNNATNGIGQCLSTSSVHESTNGEYKSGTDDPYQNTPAPENTKSPKSSGYGGTGNQQQPARQPTVLDQLAMKSETQPSHPSSSYSEYRNYDYTKKYPMDELGKEVSENARVWKVYLDEAEETDREMLSGFRDTLDALLVFAALFSAVVTSFVISAVESLQPDYNQITAMLLVEQNLLLRAAGNPTAIGNVKTVSVNLDSADASTADLWINGLFFSSLSLSLATALLSVLVKQWLQAYSSSLPTGNARERAKICQFRYAGLTDWKVPQIIGTLPIVLHASLGLFMAGFSLYVSELQPSLCWIVVSVTAISFLMYLGSIVIPVVITIQCPYRIPLLFVPLNFIIFFPLQIGKYLWIRYCWGQWWLEWPSLPSNSIQAAEATFLKPDDIDEEWQKWDISLPHDPYTRHHSILADCIKWLQSLQSNDSMQDIVGQALHGIMKEHIIRGDDGKLQYFRPALKCYIDKLDLKLILSWILSTPRIDNEEYKSKLCTSLCTEWKEAQKEFNGFPQMDLDNILHSAACNGNLQCVKVMISVGADVNAKGWSGGFALQAAAANGHLEIVRYLVEKGADVNAKGGRYGFALQAAAAEGHLEIVRYLVEKGADVNAKGGENGFALQAAAGGHLEIVRYLVEKGADVNAKGGYYGFALEAAAAKGHLEIVRYLVEKGADVNATKEGYFGFALQAAAAWGHLEIVRYLVEKGADVNARGGRWGSALDAAYNRSGSQIAEYLVSKGAT
ncbi:hypothetical protein D9758_001427 [Tetrapyrgos nigripes]|uniref:DUF6535 domain-containing protein n=1 Tax=Tetrapyrgos nigripes TaxID=182062 RepID=A0A8H5GSF3_9AGAR|nr:hypothetical protein D9758_001427 [Tetrapyrgos nigripes]